MRHADLLPDFLLESAALLDRVEADLWVLLHEPDDADVLADAMRGFHTVKGTSSALGLDEVEAASHAGEELLCRLRDGGTATPAAVAQVRAAVAEVRGLLASLGTQPASVAHATRVWDRMPELAADLARRLGRRVEVETVDGVVLDRSLLETVRGPLTHLVRNAVDHGIEPPRVREAAGKEPTGRLWLRAHRDGDHAVLEVGDDGRGIDLGLVGLAAVTHGLVTREELSRLGADEVRDLVLQPGLSTASVVTEVSGRGVGMDVVRTAVERVGGTVELSSTPGEGTACRLRVPLTIR